jgi:hypothetical protein
VCEREGVSARDGEVGNRERNRHKQRGTNTHIREKKTESTGGGGEVEEGGSL